MRRKVKISNPQCFAPIEEQPALQADYIEFLIDCVPGLTLAGLRIVADCANGAAAAIAPELFRRLNGDFGAHLTLLNTSTRWPQHQCWMRSPASRIRGERSEGARCGDRAYV